MNSNKELIPVFYKTADANAGWAGLRLTSAGLGIEVEPNDARTAFVASIKHGAVIVTPEQVENNNFQGDAITGKGSTIDGAIVDLGDNFARAASSGTYAATFKPLQGGYTGVTVWENAKEKGLKIVGVAITSGDRVVSPFKPNEP